MLLLLIKAKRKTEIVAEIDGILVSKILEPGRAGKLKGKLGFASSQLWGKVGRAFFLAISERQYIKFYEPTIHSGLSRALELALIQWKSLIKDGPPRAITPASGKPADVVIFTDGFTPDARKDEKGRSAIGATLFDRRMGSVAQFFEEVPKVVIDAWMPRKTQICMVELAGAVVALETFKDYVQDSSVLLLVDAEAVEGALVKGYSSRADLCELVGKFWDLALKYNCSIYIDRVPTDANCADAPSRGKLQIGERLGWKTIQARWPRSVWPEGRAWD